MFTVSDPRLLVHILSSVIAFSVLCVAGLLAVLLVLLERQLRRRSPGAFLRMLPPLETLETLLCRMLWLGFLLLTLVLVTSLYLFYHQVIASPPPGLIQKTVMAVAAWAIFAVILAGRHFLGWRGRKMNYGTLLGVVMLIVIYFVSLLIGVTLS